METNPRKCFKTSFQKPLSDNDDERHVDEGVDWYQADGGGGGKVTQPHCDVLHFTAGTIAVSGEMVIKQEIVWV